MQKSVASFLLGVVAAAGVWCAVPATALGDELFVTNYADANNDLNSGTVGAYTTSGATVNASLVTGLGGAGGIAVSGGDLFVGSFANGTIGEYDATTGATINASLITGLIDPIGIVVSGGNLFIGSTNGGGPVPARSANTPRQGRRSTRH